MLHRPFRRSSALGLHFGKHLDANLGALWTNSDALGANLDALGANLGALGGNLDALRANLDALGANLDALEANLDALGANLDALGANLVALGANLDALGANSDLQKPSKVLYCRQISWFPPCQCPIGRSRANLDALVLNLSSQVLSQCPPSVLQALSKRSPSASKRNLDSTWPFQLMCCAKLCSAV